MKIPEDKRSSAQRKRQVLDVCHDSTESDGDALQSKQLYN
jgi:hypothetical protein